MLKEFMYTTDPNNEHLEDKNIQSSTTLQILKASDTNEHEETKETVLSKTEETKPQLEKKCSCPPQGTLNKTITNGAILFMIWCVAWSFSGPEVLPDGSLFGLLIIFYGAVIGGKLLEVIRIPSVPQLPPLLAAMLQAALQRSPHGKRLNLSMAIFVVGAVSPAVVVPSMLHLQEKGYGFEKGIPTLLIAASSLDDIVAITGFNTSLSIIFSGGVLSNLLSAFRDVLVGVLVGIVLGMFTRYFPSRDQGKRAVKRAFLILSMCVSAVLGSHRIGLHAAGGLCTLVLSFIAGTSWSKEKIRVQKIIGTAWDIFQPLLFGLVGAEVSVTSLKSNAIGICVATLSLALLVRISFTFVLMSFAGFNFKEKIFIALSWMPKATVQAVLGPLALERARISAPHLEPYSKDVMTIAFLAILITAPNGALIIGILGPKVLTRHDPNKRIRTSLKS
ncbi:sodium/hydrogen exchanger 9B1 isoform X2 [Physeter macrocephalus]|uniref:Sodium/hydrogen exchanger 9B1 isoform X2 n=1 Tax=Physeter macrocephalus TaxID=9755 RepID=A0A455BG52_PHYMC|nr:sodium/hydrogen exchanger 9B1 isoform X2 [Physeter catodon]|eukprot:XP_028347940.1 sodium/hydrogen exchanger 9B1 isoform X2 [Physeter catodon]